MARPQLTRALTLALGAAYVIAGVVMTSRALMSDEGGRTFWFATLVGGGTLVLVGKVLAGRQPQVGIGLVCVGSLLGIVATLGTVVVPLVAVAVVALNLLETQRAMV